MSAHYDLGPLSSFLSLPTDLVWLENMGLTLPEQWEGSRDPTAQEVRAAVHHLVDEGKIIVEEEFHVAGDDLDAILANGSEHTFISIVEYATDRSEDTPRHTSFQYGSAELVLVISERLSRICGPLLLTRDNAYFIIVNAGISPFAHWAVADF